MRERMVGRAGLPGIAACVVVGALAVAGCGGGGSTTTVTTTSSTGAGGGGSAPLSQGEFVLQANAACKEANNKIEALKALPKNADLTTLAGFTGKQITIAKQSYAKLAAITPPSNLQDEYAAYLADGKVSIDVAQQLESAAKSGNTSQIKSLVRKLAVGNKLGNGQAKALGLDECAKDVKAQG